MDLIQGPNPHLNPRALDDLGLIQQAVSGNQSAYKTLFERYHQAVLHFVYQRTRNMDDARDLTLEAFGKAFLKLHSYVPNYSFSTWLFRIAQNNYVDFVRRNRLMKLHETNFEGSLLLQLEDEALNPEAQLIRQERIALVYTLLQQVAPRYRRMLELRFYEDLSYEEMAETLQIPLGTVKAQLYRAKEMLRLLLQAPLAHA